MLERDDGNGRDHAVVGELLAIAQDDGVSVADAKTVDVDNAGLDGSTALDDTATHLERVAVIEDKDMVVLDAHLAGQLGMGAQMNGLAVNRHKVRGLGHGHQELELLLAAVTRDVNEGAVLVPHVAAKLSQAVDDLLDGFLIARNRSCREDNGIALVDGERLVLAVGHAGQGRQRLALRTGAHDDNLVVGQVINVEGIDDIGIVDIEVAELTRHAGVSEHGATGHNNLTAALAGGIADLLQTMDVARERRDEHATRRVLDGVQQVGTNLGLGLGKAGNRGIGGVGKQQVNALLGKAADSGVVGRDAVDGRLVELKVARVHNGALIGADEHAQSAGDRVRHREEVERDAAEVDMAAALDLAELRCADAELRKLALDKAKRQFAREDGHLIVEVLQQIRKRTGVVLVAVGDDDTAEFLLVFKNVGVVGKHQVNTGLGVVGEHKAGVDEHHVVAALEDRHVLTDAVKAAERNDLQGR